MTRTLLPPFGRSARRRLIVCGACGERFEAPVARGESVACTQCGEVVQVCDRVRRKRARFRPPFIGGGAKADAPQTDDTRPQDARVLCGGCGEEFWAENVRAGERVACSECGRVVRLGSCVQKGVPRVRWDGSGIAESAAPGVAKLRRKSDGQRASHGASCVHCGSRPIGAPPQSPGAFGRFLFAAVLLIGPIVLFALAIVLGTAHTRPRSTHTIVVPAGDIDPYATDIGEEMPWSPAIEHRANHGTIREPITRDD